MILFKKLEDGGDVHLLVTWDFESSIVVRHESHQAEDSIFGRIGELVELTLDKLGGEVVDQLDADLREDQNQFLKNVKSQDVKLHLEVGCMGAGEVV